MFLKNLLFWFYVILLEHLDHFYLYSVKHSVLGLFCYREGEVED